MLMQVQLQERKEIILVLCVIVIAYYQHKSGGCQPGKPDEDCSARCCSEDPGFHSGHRGTFCSETFNQKECVQVSNLNDKGTFCSEHPVVKLCQVYSFRRSTSKVAHQSSQLRISVAQVIFLRRPQVTFLRLIS